jgi:hypothetical protein
MPQIFRPVRREGHTLVASTISARVQIRSEMNKPTGQHIRNKAYMEHRRCQKCPCCHAHIPFTSVECSDSRVEVHSSKQGNLNPWSPAQSAILERRFKRNIDFILLLLSEHSAISFRSFLSNNGPLCLKLFTNLWSSGQSSSLEIQRSWVRFPALPDFLKGSGSGTGSNQPREDN